MADIVFPEVIEFGAQTRNGWVHQSGVSVLNLSGNLLLNPLTSKGTVGQGAISIHPRALGAVSASHGRCGRPLRSVGACGCR